MTEETLKHLTMDGLCDLLVECTKEFLESIDKKDEFGIRVKKKELELLQRVITNKKAEANKTLRKAGL